MKIGLFFGSFNPVHIGHLIIADSLLTSAQLDEVWFVVSPHNPFKDKEGLAPVSKRIEWVTKCIESHPKLQVCDIETKLPLPSYTEQTLTALKAQYPKNHFHILMGSDSYESLPKWKNASQWIHDYPIEIYQRNGSEVLELITLNSRTHKLPLLPISSTYLREQIIKNESIFYWVLEDIREEVIKTYRLRLTKY